MAFDYTTRNWDNLTYKSKGGDLKIKASAARAGATYQGALNAWGNPGTIGGRTVSGSVNPNVANPVGPQRTGALLPASVTGQSGGGSRLVNVSPGNGLGAPVYSYEPWNRKPVKGYGLTGADEQMPNHLPPGYAESHRLPSAPSSSGEVGPFLSELNPEERARVDKAGRDYDQANGVGKLNTPYTYRSAAGGVVDPTLDQRPQFNPLSNPGYKAPAGSTPMPGTAAPGAYNNEVGFKPAATAATTGPKVAGYALPGQSAYAGLTNRFDDAHIGRLLTASKNQVDDQFARSQQEITASLASRGLLNAPPSGVQYQLENEARMARDNALAGAGNQARIDAAKLATDFDITQAGGLDSFGFNKGNLALGYSADARQGQLLPAQLRAANAGASSAESRALTDNQDAYEYGTQDAANFRAGNRELDYKLRMAGFEGASLGVALSNIDVYTRQKLLQNTLDQAVAEGSIKQSEAAAAKELMASGGGWWETWGKNLVQVALVGGGAALGSIIPGVGTATGAMAGGVAASQI